MDIIIRNGVIQNGSSNKKEVNDKSICVKKDYNNNYINNISGPYYDLCDSHICIPRSLENIINFKGPQDKKKIKMIFTDDYNKNNKYCCICHTMLRHNPAYPADRKILVDEDIFKRKNEPIINNFTINDIINNSITRKYNMWQYLYKKMYKKEISTCLLRAKEVNELKVKRSNIIINKYYKLVYKLIYKPVMYPISNKEIKLLWPWEMTKYQIFKMNNPNYKNMPIYYGMKPRITENYVMID